MTTITTYPVKLYTDSSKPENDGHRLTVIRWKERKDDASYKKPAPRCVSHPRVAIIVEPSILASALQSAFETMQDDVIRAEIMRQMGDAESTTNVITLAISADAITMEAVAAYAAQQAVGNRLSKDLLESWFDGNLADNLYLRLADKLGIVGTPTEQQGNLLTSNVATAKKLVTSLASPRSMYPENIVAQLEKAISLAEDDGKIKSQLLAKLSLMKQPVTVADFGL